MCCRGRGSGGRVSLVYSFLVYLVYLVYEFLFNVCMCVPLLFSRARFAGVCPLALFLSQLTGQTQTRNFPA